MVTIAEIDTFIVDIPTIRPHVLAMATIHHQSIVLVRMRDSVSLFCDRRGRTEFQ